MYNKPIFSSVQLLSCVQLFVTLWTVVHQAPLSLGFSWQECWSGLTCLPPGDLPHPGTELTSPMSPPLQVEFLLLNHLGGPINTYYTLISVTFLSMYLGDSFILILILLFSHLVVSDSFVTLWTVACQAPLHGIFQARVLKWVSIFSFRGSS